MSASSGWDGPGRGAAALSYYIGAAPASAGVTQSQFQSTIQAALDVWAKVADLTFTQTPRAGQTDALDFQFTRLDGAGGTLAQAYFPDDVNSARIAGDVQFDSSERWEIGNVRGGSAFDLMAVAVHEIGHALGLEHSHAASSIMADSVSANQAFTSLAAADRTAILQLYAPARSTNNTTTTPTSTTTPTTTSIQPPLTTPTTPTRSPSIPWWTFRYWGRWWSSRSFSGRLDQNQQQLSADHVDAAFSIGVSRHATASNGSLGTTTRVAGATSDRTRPLLRIAGVEQHDFVDQQLDRLVGRRLNKEKQVVDHVAGGEGCVSPIVAASVLGEINVRRLPRALF